MESKELRIRIEKLKADLETRISEEYFYLSSKETPSEDLKEKFIKNLRWESPELSVFIKKEFEKIKRN